LLSWIDAAMAASAMASSILDPRGTHLQAATVRLRVPAAVRLLSPARLGAIAWLGWDWTHGRSLDAAEDAVFDKVIQHRPFEPAASKRVVVVEIDDCSIDHFRNQGEGGWPWSRQRHADLLDALDAPAIRAAGFDVLVHRSLGAGPGRRRTLEATARRWQGRFVFGRRACIRISTQGGVDHAGRGHDAGRARARRIPLSPDARRPGPPVALLLPYGDAMTRHSALLDVDRGVDGVLRDVSLYEDIGHWGIPSLALRLAAFDSGRKASVVPRLGRASTGAATRDCRMSAPPT
jgi:hypothetical protein